METNTSLEPKNTYYSFDDFNISKVFQSTLKILNFTVPTPVQTASIPLGLISKNLIVQAKAGTGKTLAYSLILLSKIDLLLKKIQCLILTPTRELSIQVFDFLSLIFYQLKQINKEYEDIKIGLSIGGLPIEDDRNFLQQGPCIVVGTLGRVLGLINEKALICEDIKIIVLDEADKLLCKDAGRNFEKIAEKIPKNIQFLAFSATYRRNDIDKFKKIVRDDNVEIVRISSEKNEKIGDKRKSLNSLEKNLIEEDHHNLINLEQYYLFLNQNSNITNFEIKINKLCELLSKIKFDQCVIFYNDKGRGEELANDLRANGFEIVFIHGDQSQVERIRLLNKFKIKKCNIVLSTDLLARGIDIEEMSLVINFDLPNNIETYFHRVGRSGRFGRFGISLILLFEKDKKFIENKEINIIEFKEECLDEINKKLNEQKEINLENKKNHQKLLVIEENKKKIKVKNPPKGFFYGKESKAGEWKDSSYQFLNEKKFKYVNEEEEEKEIPIVNKYFEKFKEENYQLFEHEHRGESNENEWEFLECKKCFEMAKRIKEDFNVDFKILSYFK